jgi:hypothetical protein
VALALCATLVGCVAYDTTGQPIRPADPRVPVLSTRVPAPPAPGFAARDFVDSALPAARIASFTTRVPLAHELPPLAGAVQLHTVTAGEDLLTIARAMGIGLRALRDANPGIDEWEPKPGTNLVVPTRWIMPRGTHAGLAINVAELRIFMFPTATRAIPLARVENFQGAAISRAKTRLLKISEVPDFLQQSLGELECAVESLELGAHAAMIAQRRACVVVLHVCCRSRSRSGRMPAARGSARNAAELTRAPCRTRLRRRKGNDVLSG